VIFILLVKISCTRK